MTCRSSSFFDDGWYTDDAFDCFNDARSVGVYNGVEVYECYTDSSLVITSPSSGQTFSSSPVHISAYLNGVPANFNKIKIYIDSSYPSGAITYGTSISYDWHISASDNGAHTITVVAYDTSDNEITRATRSISVNIASSEEPVLVGKTIVIDPGHGGNTGADGFGLWEDEVVLDVGKRLEKLFDDAGANVILTRKTSAAISWEDRITPALSSDVFVSIHCNAFNGDVYGTETYYYDDRDLSLRDPIGNDEPLVQATGKYWLAKMVQSQLLERLGTSNRGVKVHKDMSRNYLLRTIDSRDQEQLAILAELAFIDNPDDNQKLKDTSANGWRQKAAEGLYNGVLDYLKEFPTPPTPVPPPIPPPHEPFCGHSRNTACSTDNDCAPTGCSGQVCAGADESIITTCEARACFGAGAYGMACSCVDNQCQWNGGVGSSGVPDPVNVPELGWLGVILVVAGGLLVILWRRKSIK
jgi:eight-cysteine-cluster-containing protein